LIFEKTRANVYVKLLHFSHSPSEVSFNVIRVVFNQESYVRSSRSEFMKIIQTLSFRLLI